MFLTGRNVLGECGGWRRGAACLPRTATHGGVRDGIGLWLWFLVFFREGPGWGKTCRQWLLAPSNLARASGGQTSRVWGQDAPGREGQLAAGSAQDPARVRHFFQRPVVKAALRTVSSRASILGHAQPQKGLRGTPASPSATKWTGLAQQEGNLFGPTELNKSSLHPLANNVLWN